MLKLYNSLDKKVSEFKPLGDTVKMYSCGPTVYSYAHIGNMRAYIFMDLIRRVLRYNGYKIEGVLNITDVGHMTSDADEGEDKMQVASRREKKTPWEIAKYYEDFFFTQTKKLNVDIPEHVVRATDTIEEIIDFVKGLVEKGYGYETSKGIYFDIKKFADYGMLSGVSLDDKLAGARIEVDEEKRHPADFALWVKAPKEHIMQWESPWGMGYPGWHIECSAMGKKFLGDAIDIHTGGIDHLTVHHENEIAQSNALEGKQVVNRWMHVDFLQVDGGKMSKSLGNIYTVDNLEEMGYNPLDFRYFCLNAHYSKKQNFTLDGLSSARTSLERLYELTYLHKNQTGINDNLEEYENQFQQAINHDLNIPLALSVLWNLLKETNKSDEVYKLALKFDTVLGLSLAEYQTKEHEISEEVKLLAEERWQAKLNRNFKTADELREKISNLGYEILDAKDNYQIVKK